MLFEGVKAHGTEHHGDRIREPTEAKERAFGEFAIVLCAYFLLSKGWTNNHCFGGMKMKKRWSARDIIGKTIRMFVTLSIFICLSVCAGTAISSSTYNILFTSNKDGNGNIYKTDDNFSSIIQLTSNIANESAPRWSTDKSRIFYVRGNDIWTMMPDGSGQAQLTSLGNIVSLWDVYKSGAKLLIGVSGDTLAKVGVDGTGYATIRSSADTALISPDGTTIAFKNGSTSADIYKMNEDGTGAALLYHGTVNTYPSCMWVDNSSLLIHEDSVAVELKRLHLDGSVDSISNSLGAVEGLIAADGHTVYFLNQSPGDLKIMKGDLSGAPAVQQYDPIATFGAAIYFGDYRASSSGTGEYIYFRSAGNIYRMNPDGTGQEVILDHATETYNAPRPSGQYGKLFVGRDNATNTNAYPFYSDLIGGGETQISTNGNQGNNTRVVPSPLGMYVFYTISSTWDEQVNRIYFDGSGDTTILSSGYHERIFDASNDGKILYSMVPPGNDGGAQMFEANADGSSPVALSPADHSYFDMRYSPDLLKILYFQGVGNAVCVMNRDGSGKVDLSLDTGNEYFGVSWSPDGNKITYGKLTGAVGQIYVMNADGTGKIQITNIGSGAYNPFWISIGEAISTCNGGPLAWSQGTSMPTARHVFAMVSCSGSIFAIGGISNASTIADLEVYDPNTGFWIVKTSMPTARRNPAAAVCNGKIYVIGGNNAGAGMTTVEMYDPTTDTWYSKAGLPAGRGASAVAVLQGKIYACGGNATSAFGGEVGDVYEYDPGANTWTTKASLGTARSCAAAVSMNGKLYVIGGKDVSGNTQGIVEEYDPSANAWTSRSAMTPRSSVNQSGFAFGGRIYVAGGRLIDSDQGSTTSLVESYDPALNTWRKETSMTVPRSGLGTAVVGCQVYAVGGVKADSSLTGLMEIADVVSAPSGNQPSPGSGPIDNLEKGRIIVSPNRLDLSKQEGKAKFHFKGDAGGVVSVRIFDSAGRFMGEAKVTLNFGGVATVEYGRGGFGGYAPAPGAYWIQASGGGVNDKKLFFVTRKGK